MFFSKKYKMIKSANFAIWCEIKLGLGLSANYIPPSFGNEPFIVGQFLCFWFFVSVRSNLTGDKYNEEKNCMEEI